MRYRLPILITLLLLAFWGVLRSLDDASLWYDEAWSLYAVAAPPPATYEPPRGVRAIAREAVYAARDDLTTTLRRVRTDVHPPLYFLLLDVWTALVGDSPFALRYPSLMAALVGMATVAALGRYLFGAPSGVYAAALAGSSLMWTYYAAEVRMYALLMTLAAAATLAFVRLWNRPTVTRISVYGVLVALGVYTHYTAALVPLAHGLYALGTRRPRLIGVWAVGSIVGLLIYAPWLSVVYQQFVTNPSGPLLMPEPTNWTTVQTLTGYFAGRIALIYAALGAVLLFTAWRGRAVLLLLWLVVVPAAVFAVNAWLMPVYNPRYTLAALPALHLLGGAGLVALGRRGQWWRWVAVVVAALMVADGLTAYDGTWGAKPPYRTTVAGVVASRNPAAPVFVRVDPTDPFIYHARRAGLLHSAVVDLAWGDPAVDQVRALAARFADVPDVWVAAPTNHPATWALVAALNGQGRVVTYRDGVQNTVVYRLTHPDGRGMVELPLELTWGTLNGEFVAAFNGDLLTDIPATAGEQVCLVPPVQGAADGVTVSLSLTRGYNGVLDQWHGPPGETACVSLPVDAVGDYGLYIGVHTLESGDPYPVWDGPVWWGNWIVMARVSVPVSQ